MKLRTPVKYQLEWQPSVHISCAATIGIPHLPAFGILLTTQHQEREDMNRGSSLPVQCLLPVAWKRNVGYWIHTKRCKYGSLRGETLLLIYALSTMDEHIWYECPIPSNRSWPQTVASSSLGILKVCASLYMYSKTQNKIQTGCSKMLWCTWSTISDLINVLGT